MAEGGSLPRTSRRLAAAALIGMVACPVAFAQDATLPTGFGPFALGMPWSEARETGPFIELTHATSAWERLVYECGYRNARFQLDGGSVLVTAQEHIVTELGQTQAIPPDTDVMQVAARVIAAHGEPLQATLRDEFGAVTTDPARIRYVVLDYRGEVDARFSISGAPLWTYRITVSDGDARRLENRTIRCARELESARSGKTS